MSVSMRFGRKLPLSPVSVIKHQLKMMAASDALAEAFRVEKTSHIEIVATIKDLTKQFNFSESTVNLLIDRLSIDRAMPQRT